MLYAQDLSLRRLLCAQYSGTRLPHRITIFSRVSYPFSYNMLLLLATSFTRISHLIHFSLSFSLLFLIFLSIFIALIFWCWFSEIAFLLSLQSHIDIYPSGCLDWLYIICSISSALHPILCPCLDPCNLLPTNHFRLRCY